MIAEAQASELEEALNSKSLVVEDLTRSNVVLQEEVLRLREDLELAGKRIGDLKERNMQLNTAWDEAVAANISVQEELAYCKFGSFKKHVIDDFKSGGEFVEEVGKEAATYIDKGCVYIIKQLHHHF